MKFKPKTKDELYSVIKTIIENQIKTSSYRYGLKDVDVSLITDVSDLFSCYDDNRNFEINEKINWNDRRNSIVDWNVSNVTNMKWLFSKSSFNQPIGNWDVSNVLSMNSIFESSSFNQDISKWNVSKVTNMQSMFAISKFNKPLNSWNVSSVTNMKDIFTNSEFNQPLNSWNVSNVTDMTYMFHSSKFNQDISNWDISNVISMEEIVAYSDFDKNLNKWILKMNKNCNLFNFNYYSKHRNIYGKIDYYNEFIEKQLTKQFIEDIFKNGNDIDKYKLLKIIKNYPDIIKNIDIGREIL